MKIFINEIPPEGLTVKGEVKADKLGLDIQQVNFLTPIYAECFLTKTKDDLFAKCTLSANARETCSRCLVEFNAEFKKEIDLYYPLKGMLTLELDGGIKDEIIIDYPIKILCKENCKGLCHRCGKNLNEGPCGCKEKNG